MTAKERRPLSEGARVLFVGDEPTGRAVRLECELATDVDEAVERLADRDFDCVVCAHEPPTFDAFDLLGAVREHGGPPVVLLVERDDRDAVPAALAEGATEYVLTDGEPDVERLSTRIAVAVDRRRGTRAVSDPGRNRIETPSRLDDVVHDSVVQLEFRVRDSEHFLAHASERAGCEVTLDGTVSRSDGSTLQYCTVSGARPEQIRDLAERSDQIAHVRLVGTGGEESVFELTFAGQSMVAPLANYGVNLRTVTADRGELGIVVEVARETDVRTVVEAFENAFHGSELVAQRESNRPVQTAQEFRSKLERTLTARQRAALRASYLAGFFEWPRESTGEDVADGLGIAPATYHQHLRVGERKLLEAFFDEGFGEF